jgi:flagellar protein FliS
MFLQFKPNASTYARVDLEGRVTSADPHQLIVLLYDGAILALTRAEAAIARKDIAAKATWITHAVSIIVEGLQTALDKDAGGSLARNLEDLYTYMARRLFEANMHSDAARVAEVRRLLDELRGAWLSIRGKTSNTLPAPSRAPQLAMAGAR